LIPKIAAEQGGNPCARHAEREAGLIVTGQYEDVAEQFADGLRVYVAAIGRPFGAPLLVPIGEKLSARRMFHSLLPRGARAGTFLSRFSASAFPAIVVQEGLCSVHAAAVFCGVRGRLCAVKVKLTMWLAAKALLLQSAHPR